MSDSVNTCPVEIEFFHSEGRTDVSKLITNLKTDKKSYLVGIC